MAANLTDQVRNIAQVATAVANGDLGQKITVDARARSSSSSRRSTRWSTSCRSFADEVTRVAREVGTEGKLGGQAEVEGVSGTWRDLTENVNQLAGNLTTQVRAIAEVSTAVTQGDLTRSITVEAQGEVAELKDNINQMIANLRETTQINAEQDWLKTNLARISGMLQGQRDLEAVTQLIMSEVTPLVSAQHGAFFLVEHGDCAGEPSCALVASYGYKPAGAAAARPLRARRGPRRPGGGRGQDDPRSTDVPDGLHQDHLGPRRGDARATSSCHAGPVRGAGARRDRAGLAAAVQRGQPRLPRPAHRDDRRRAQHDPAPTCAPRSC